MKDKLNSRSRELDSLALQLLDFCGGELYEDGIANFFKVHHPRFDTNERQLIITCAEQLISTP